jgi:hypothetical protein
MLFGRSDLKLAESVVRTTLKPTELMAWAASVTKRVLWEDIVQTDEGGKGYAIYCILSLGDNRAIRS